jgi:hypothetical protein
MSVRDNVFEPPEFSAIVGFGAGIRPHRIPDILDMSDRPVVIQSAK